MSSVFVIAHLEIKRMIRNNMTWLLFFISLFLLFFMDRFNYFTIEEQMKMIKDFSLGIMNLVSLLIAVYYPVNMIKEDFSSKIIFPILSTPITRGYLLLGKTLSLYFLLAFVVILNSLSLWLILLSKGGNFSTSLLIAVFSIYLKNITLIGFAFFFSLLPISEFLSIILTFFVFALGTVKSYFLLTPDEHIPLFAVLIQKVIFSIVPNFRIYDVVESITLGKNIPIKHLQFCFMHFLGVSILIYGITFYIFRKKDI